MAPPAGGSGETDASRLLSLTNDLRGTVGLPPLTLDAPATGVATGWAEQLAGTDGISHNPDLAAEMPEGWAKIGENVGMGGDVEAIHEALVRSPSHYDNLVQAGFTRVGIAVVARPGVVYAVEDFVRYASDPLPAPTETPPGAPASLAMVPAAPTTVPVTVTTAPGNPPATPTVSEPGFAVVAPGPAPQIDAGAAAAALSTSPLPDPEEGRFGFVLEQLRNWDRGR